MKIGKARTPRHRLGTMQVDNADKLTLVAIEASEGSKEKELHRRFKHLRIRGEWYEGADELWEYIGGLHE